MNESNLAVFSTSFYNAKLLNSSCGATGKPPNVRQQPIARARSEGLGEEPIPSATSTRFILEVVLSLSGSRLFDWYFSSFTNRVDSATTPLSRITVGNATFQTTLIMPSPALARCARISRLRRIPECRFYSQSSRTSAVSVLFQDIDPPVINGVRKPKKPGGKSMARQFA